MTHNDRPDDHVPQATPPVPGALSVAVMYLRQNWSRSPRFRAILTITLLYTLLRLAGHILVLAMLLFPNQSDLGGALGWSSSDEPMLPIDLQIYLDAAEQLQLRQDLYLQEPLAQLDAFYQYAPSFALALTPVLWLPSFITGVVHTLLNIAAYGLLYVWWNRLFHRLGLERVNDLLAWMLPLWLIFAAFWNDMGYLNVYTIMALLGTLLIDAVLDERLGWSLLWISIVLQIKPQWAFAAAVPLFLGRWRFFFKLLSLAGVAYAAVVGVTMLATGPSYGWRQYGDYFQLLLNMSADFPWRGPDAPFLGYNHSIMQIVLYLRGVTPGAMRLATGIKVLLLTPLAALALRLGLRPAGCAGRQVPQQALDLAFALYLGAFIWLDVVWEASLSLVIFVYLLATLEQRHAKILAGAVFLPYTLVDLWQMVSFAVFGEDVLEPPGPLVTTDPTIYVPWVMVVIVTFYALLLRRLWTRPGALGNHGYS